MSRRAVHALVLAAALLAVFAAWQRFRPAAPGPAPAPPGAAPVDPAAEPQPDTQPPDAAAQVPPPAGVEDPDLGLRAPAPGLIREVSMLQWQESCDAAGCRHALAWSAQPIDSAGFRSPAPEANPPFPFASARFGIAAGSDAAGTPWPVRRDMLPENLRASFGDDAGTLLAGDRQHPAAGDLRIRYRIIQEGEVP